MIATFRPLSPVDAERLAPRGDGSWYAFRASYADTLQLLDHELQALDADSVIIEIGLRERDIRLDGQPRADAPQPEHPGVVISFDSRHGPLRYGTGEFPRWQHNLRAIALGLSDLRRVDRYGITKRGEQYTGFRALEAGSDDRLRSRGKALIEEHGSVRRAEIATHPDRGGDAEDFRAVQLAAGQGA